MTQCFGKTTNSQPWQLKWWPKQRLKALSKSWKLKTKPLLEFWRKGHIPRTAHFQAAILWHPNNERIGSLLDFSPWCHSNSHPNHRRPNAESDHDISTTTPQVSLQAHQTPESKQGSRKRRAQSYWQRLRRLQNRQGLNRRTMDGLSTDVLWIVEAGRQQHVMK